MADDKAVGEDEKKEPSTTATKNVRQKRRGSFLEFGMDYLGYMGMILRRGSNTYLKKRLQFFLE